jgi:hypothetical protein
MSAGIHGNMAYSFERPQWHNLRAPSVTKQGAVEVLENDFGGNIPISLRPIWAVINNEMQETGGFAIVRGKTPFSDEEVILDYCTDRYHVLQPIDIAQSYDDNVGEYVETMAFLGKDAHEMFISWNMPKFEVLLGDVVELYGIVRVGFYTKSGARLFTSIYRPVCANTINMAENWARRNSDGKNGLRWRGSGVNENLLEHLGYWMKHVQQNAKEESDILKEFLSTMAQRPVNDGIALSLLRSAFPYQYDNSKDVPVELRVSTQEKVQEYNEKIDNLRNGIFELFQGKGTEITPTAWGLICAGSEFLNHVQPSKRPIAQSVMFGGRYRKITKLIKTIQTELG